MDRCPKELRNHALRLMHEMDPTSQHSIKLFASSSMVANELCRRAEELVRSGGVVIWPLSIGEGFWVCKTLDGAESLFLEFRNGHTSQTITPDDAFTLDGVHALGKSILSHGGLDYWLKKKLSLIRVAA